MEKFTQWRDPGTGLSPFLENSFEIYNQNIFFLFLGSILFLIRHMFIFMLFTTYVIFVHLLLSPILQPIFPKIVHIVKKIFIGIALLSCGIFPVSAQIDTHVKSKKKVKSGPRPKDIIISRCCSPLDVLCLIFNYNPIFTISFSNTPLVQHISGIEAMFYMLSSPKRPSFKNYMTLDYLSKLYPNRIICVFPEGTTSNGRGLLLFTRSLESVALQTKIFPLFIRYNPYLTTPHPKSLFKFLFRLTFNLTHSLHIKISETPIISESHQKTSELASVALSKLSKIPRLGLGIDDKIAFLKVWKTI